MPIQRPARPPRRGPAALARDVLGIIEFPGSRRWAAASLIDAIGSGLLMPLTVLYFTIHVGLSPASVGLGLTVGGLGFGVGGLLASVALAIGGTAYLFVVYGNAISFLVALALIAGMPVPRVQAVRGAALRSATDLRTVLSDGRYLGLTALDFFSSFHATALEVALPLWVVLHTHAPRALTGILFTLNTAIVVLVQVRATSTVRALADIPRAYRRAAELMVLCAAAYLAAHYVSEAGAIVLLAVGLLLHTGTEMLISVGEWTASIELADDSHRGKYLSVFSVGNSIQDAVGPLIVTSILLLGDLWLWPAIAALVCTGSLLTAGLTRRAVAARPQLAGSPV